jgi:cell wall-associated NlpC family hydrolase
MRFFRLCTLLACAVGVSTAAMGNDDLDRFLNERGLLEQSAPSDSAAAMPPTPPAPTSAEVPSQSAADGDQRMSGLVVAAMGALGLAYRRGGNDYESGFDCSGFVRALYQQNFNLLLPRRAAEQAAATQSIARDELKPGDLVFFNTLNRAYSHVGIYVGDHRFIHSPRTGAVVRIEDMRVNYWNRRYNGARRVVGQSVAAAPLRAATTDTVAPPNY